ncbi:NAD-dependent epimerase/dehydratase family protein [Fulvivirga sp.]|uniref:NAD-dependent epimerase/dehydratase family protein n=1 Tax=Fulvivirga sp. TaxID=1931237 RepID=UPI0032EABA85
MQTILGAGGAIGTELTKALPKFTNEIKLVGRNPVKVNDTDLIHKADLLNEEAVIKAVEGSKIVYLTVGLVYKTKIWQEQWPIVMNNAIEACRVHKTKLVFFDNVYMYDRDALKHMTEKTPIRPTSDKGRVREKVAHMVMDAHEKGDIEALIARAADFIGPINSVPTETIYKNLAKGKKADWFASLNMIHSFTDTTDAAIGTAMLGNAATSFGDVWHLPTDPTPLTVTQWIELFGKEMNINAKGRALPLWMMGVLGIFIPVLKELKEMAYQYDRDYYFDSTKFNRRFEYKPSTPEVSVKRVVDYFNK